VVVVAPGSFGEELDASSDEGAAAEDDRDGSVAGRLRELAHPGVFDAVREHGV
jgi:hypothetical protein